MAPEDREVSHARWREKWASDFRSAVCVSGRPMADGAQHRSACRSKSRCQAGDADSRLVLQRADVGAVIHRRASASDARGSFVHSHAFDRDPASSTFTTSAAQTCPVVPSSHHRHKSARESVRHVWRRDAAAFVSRAVHAKSRGSAASHGRLQIAHWAPVKGRSARCLRKCLVKSPFCCQWTW